MRESGETEEVDQENCGLDEEETSGMGVGRGQDPGQEKSMD